MQAHIAKQSTATSTYRPQRLVGILTQHFAQLSSALIHTFAPQDSLHIYTRELRDQVIWVVRDRTTQAQHEFTSEQTLRTWLEQRYYQ